MSFITIQHNICNLLDNQYRKMSTTFRSSDQLITPRFTVFNFMHLHFDCGRKEVCLCIGAGTASNFPLVSFLLSSWVELIWIDFIFAFDMNKWILHFNKLKSRCIYVNLIWRWFRALSNWSCIVWCKTVNPATRYSIKLHNTNHTLITNTSKNA